MDIQNKFEQIKEKKWFFSAVIAAHLVFGYFIFTQFMKRSGPSYIDLLVTTNILLVAGFWKLFAKSQKKKYEQK